MKQPISNRSLFLRLAAAVLSAAYILSLLPILALSRYAAPEPNDDMLYGAAASAAWEETHSLGAVAAAAAEHTATVYRVAHGRVASTFFGSLYLGLAGLKHYWTVPLLLLAALTGGTLLLFYALARRLMKLSWAAVIGVTALAALCRVQFMASPGEGLFWFCGGSTYTLYYALTETLLALAVLQWTAKGKGARALFGVLAVVTAALASGWGYTCLIPTAALLAGWILLAAILKRRDALITAALALALFALGTGIQLTAPGIANRAQWEQLAYGYQPSGPVKAAGLSLIYGLSALISRLDGGMLAFIALTVMAALPALKNSPWRFRYPLAVTVLSWGLFCTQLCPSMMATSTMGPLRQWNVLYFSMFPLFAFNGCYIAGWAVKRAGAKAEGEKQPSLAAARPALLLGALLVLLCGTAFRQGFLKVTGVAAAREMLDGSAQARYAAWQEEQAQGAPMGERKESRFLSY